MEVNGLHLTVEDLSVVRVLLPDYQQGAMARFEAAGDGEFVILLDKTPRDQDTREGLANEIVKQMNLLRKRAKLVATDDGVRMEMVVLTQPGGVDLEGIVREYGEMIETKTRSPVEVTQARVDAESPHYRETHASHGLAFVLQICADDGSYIACTCHCKCLECRGKYGSG
jgi:hypothetical protein